MLERIHKQGRRLRQKQGLQRKLRLPMMPIHRMAARPTRRRPSSGCRGRRGGRRRCRMCLSVYWSDIIPSGESK